MQLAARRSGGAQYRLTNPIAVVSTGNGPFCPRLRNEHCRRRQNSGGCSKGLDMPPGYLFDEQGQPTVKTADFYDGGCMVPRLHKGYALSLFLSVSPRRRLLLTRGEGGDGRLLYAGAQHEAFTPLADYQRNVRLFLDAMKATPLARL